MSSRDINKLKKQLITNKEKDVFEQLLSEETWALGVDKSSIITGTVVDVDNDHRQVIIDTGLKSYSSINFSEFQGTEIPSKETQINVFLERISDTGTVIVSYRKVKFEERMKELENIFLKKEPIKVKILSKTRMSSFGRNNYVVDLESGVVGILNNENYDTLNTGDEVSVVIIKYDNNRKFGIVTKQEESDKSVVETKNNQFMNNDVNVGKVFPLIIKEIKDFGIIGELEEKRINVLVHVSELFWTKKLKSAIEIEKVYPIGNKVNAILIKNDKQTDSNNRKNIFSVKRCYENPYEIFDNYMQKHGNNKIIIEGKIFEIRNDDVLLDVKIKIDNQELSLEGKIHKLDFDWNKDKSFEEFHRLQVNNVVTGMILYNNNKDKKEYDYVSISVKHTKTNEFDVALQNNIVKIGNIYDCNIKEYIASSDVFLVDIENCQVTGIIKRKDLGELNKIINKNSYKAVGKIVQAKIINITPETRSIVLSVRAIEEENMEKVMNNSDESNTKVGDILHNIID